MGKLLMLNVKNHLGNVQEILDFIVANSDAIENPALQDAAAEARLINKGILDKNKEYASKRKIRG